MKSGSLEHVAENEDSEIKNLRMILHKFEESENDSPQICPNYVQATVFCRRIYKYPPLTHIQKKIPPDSPVSPRTDHFGAK